MEKKICPHQNESFGFISLKSFCLETKTIFILNTTEPCEEESESVEPG